MVSIGNLTAGGTGKTPVTEFIAQRLIEKGKSVSIVSRGYGGQISGTARVHLDSGIEFACRQFGEEPSLYTVKNPSIPVFVGGDRVSVCEMAEKDSKPDIILADDAFQHLRLKRNFDIVLIDATQDIGHYEFLPLGRAREGFAALHRAQAIILTKANLCTELQLNKIREKLRSEISESTIVIEMDFLTEHVRCLSTEKTISMDQLKGKDVMLVSAIGNPKAFESGMMSYGLSIVEIQTFADHHFFSSEEVEQILSWMSQQDQRIVLMTEKDAIKLSHFSFPEEKVWSTILEVQPRNPQLMSQLDETLAKLPL